MGSLCGLVLAIAGHPTLGTDGLARKGNVAEITLTGVATHSFRHTYRSWLDDVGTAVTVQQKFMRHSYIRTTLNIYGDVVTDEM